MLLIADESKAIALAGVMGGQNTEINDATTDVLIESAYFKPQNIRATAKKLDLRTEASYRFERGGDIGICDWASRRAAQLILETAGGQLAEGVVDAYPNRSSRRKSRCAITRPTICWASNCARSGWIYYLGQLGLKIANRKAPARGRRTGRPSRRPSAFRPFAWI